jgi:hypothetical protein
MTLEEIRSQWEEGLVLLSVITTPEHVLVILKNEDTWHKGVTINDLLAYHCHRYFKVGEVQTFWACSVDCQNVPLDTVWSWLSNPSAIHIINLKTKAMI